MMNGVNGVSVVPVIKLQGNEKCSCPVETDCNCDNFDGEKVDPSLYGKIMQNLALASMMMNNRRSNLAQMGINNMNQQMLEQQNMLTNMLMHQQAMQDHMTAVQMTTPGMGMI